MDNQLLLPALKHKIISHFFSYNFKSGNQHILEYLRNLENITYKDDLETKNKLEQFCQKIGTLSTTIIRSIRYEHDLYPLIEDELNVVLSNISDVVFLKNILYFFEPNLNLPYYV